MDFYLTVKKEKISIWRNILKVLKKYFTFYRLNSIYFIIYKTLITNTLKETTLKSGQPNKASQKNIFRFCSIMKILQISFRIPPRILSRKTQSSNDDEHSPTDAAF